MNLGTQHRLNVEQLDGVKVLVSQDASFNLQTTRGENPEELLPKEYSWLSLLGSLGVACKPEKWTNTSNFENEVLAVSGQFFNNLNDEQITALLKKNVMFLDGESVQILFERPTLRTLIDAEKLEIKRARTNYQSY